MRDFKSKNSFCFEVDEFIYNSRTLTETDYFDNTFKRDDNKHNDFGRSDASDKIHHSTIDKNKKPNKNDIHIPVFPQKPSKFPQSEDDGHYQKKSSLKQYEDMMEDIDNDHYTVPKFFS